MPGVEGERRSAEAASRYRIVSQLGQGGTADVFLAFADGPGGFRKLVVLKVLKPSLRADHEFRAMFLGEARLAARLRHQNIVQTNEVLELDGAPTMVLEYLEGQPLSQVITRGKLGGFTLPMQLRVLADALAGLHAAHELRDFDGTPLGVVHRDVSPHNLFVTVEGHAKVLDFGIAKLERSLVETEVGTIKGKLRYMAPEQIAGERLDRRADVYAAGVMLWEALAGERMWAGCAEHEIRARVRSGDVPAPRAAHPDAPPGLERICRRALALAPAARQQTALEMAEELEAALRQTTGAAGHREIGATVAALFEDVRAETREAIERALAGGPATGVAAASRAASADVVTPSAPAGLSVVLDGGGRAPEEAAADSGARPARSRRRLALGHGIAAAALVVVLVVVGIVGSRRSDGGGAPAPGGTGAAALPNDCGAASPSPPPEAAHAAPGVTTVEAPVPTAAVMIPPAPALPRARSTGRSGGGNHGRPAPRRVPSAAAAPGPAAVGGAAGGATLDCDHPFFVDANGIKKFRPECK